MSGTPMVKIKPAFASIGGNEANNSATKKFRHDYQMQTNECSALLNLLSFHFVSKHNELHLVIRAMQAFPEKATLQSWACTMLYNICLLNEMKATISKTDGLFAAVTAAFEKHPNNDDFQKWARKAMQTLVSKATKRYR